MIAWVLRDGTCNRAVGDGSPAAVIAAQEVYLANPSSEHAQLVREGSRELRRAAAEVLEMTEKPQDAAAAAGLFQAVLSAHHLVPGAYKVSKTSQEQLKWPPEGLRAEALWATALVDASNAPLRAAQEPRCHLVATSILGAPRCAAPGALLLAASGHRS